MKRTVPLIITATVGILLIIATFVPALSEWSEDATTFFAIIAAMAFVLGGTAVLLAPEVMYVRGLNIRSTSNSFLHMF